MNIYDLLYDFSSNMAFAKIPQLLNEYQSGHDQLSQSESNFLLAIENRFRAIISTYHAWMKNGVIDDARQLNKPLTQQMIIDEYLTIQQKSKGFVCIAVGQLLHDIRVEKKNNISNLEYIRLLDKIAASTLSVLDNVKNNVILSSKATYQTSAEAIDDVKSGIYTNGLNGYTQFINALNGRYLPFTQEDDPFRSREKNDGSYQGGCSGHVATWCKGINKSGFYSSMYCLDAETYESQHHQVVDHLCADWVSDFYAETDFRMLLSNLLDHVQSDKVYRLFIHPGTDEAHVMGLRYISSCHSFECFDPNYGTFVFEQRECFIIFLANLLCDEYFSFLTVKNVVKGELKLYESGNQPENAIPSIPPLTTQLQMTAGEINAIENELTFSLSAEAMMRGIKLEDHSYLQRHWSNILAGAGAGLSVSRLLPYLTQGTSLMNPVTAALTATCIAAGIVVESNSKLISSIGKAAFMYLLNGLLWPFPDKEIDVSKYEKEHLWVDKRCNNGIGSHAFLFKTRTSGDEDIDAKQCHDKHLHIKSV